MEIQVQKRDIFGKKTKTLKNQGLIPAELYGHKVENVHLSVPQKDFSKLYKQAGESTVINLVLDNKKIPALIHDTSVNFLTDEFSHVDFYAVNMKEKIKTAVPFSFVGESPAIKIGGILVKSMHELEVEALPGDLPAAIEVDLSKLADIHNSIHVKDLNISNKVKLFIDPEAVVATIVEAAEEEVEVKPVTVEDVKVEGEEKKKEKEAKESAEAKK